MILCVSLPGMRRPPLNHLGLCRLFGRFAKDQFTINLTAATVRCPAGTTTAIRPAGSGGWMATSGRLAPAGRWPCSAPKVPVEKTFRPFDPDQVLLLPPSLDDWLPAEHLARFVAELVDEHLDLSRIPRRLPRRARRAAVRPAPDGPVVALWLRDQGALVAGDRAALRRRCPVPLAGVWCGAGLPVDRPVPQAGGWTVPAFVDEI